MFIEEDSTGTSPKVLIRDRAGVLWRVKGGLENKAESFATRLVAALGYYAEPTAFISRGRIKGTTSLNRAKGFIQADGRFSDAAFERRDAGVKFLSGQDWTWEQNPFLGMKELRGLKVLMMMLSNWDNKDARNWWRGSNTGILERRAGSRVEWIYFVNDWGQTLGAWGSEIKPKGWDCAAYGNQTATFIREREGPLVRFGFVGLHTDDFSNDITVDDVRWLMRYLGRISDSQLRSGLKASGASTQEADCFTRAIRDRITQLKAVSSPGGPLKPPRDGQTGSR
jgi:hypothetical protein